MKQVRIVLSDEQLDALKSHYFAELAPADQRRDVEALEAAREHAARKLEQAGYSTQAEQMRSGRLDVTQYIDIDQETPIEEMIGATIAEQVPELSVQ